MGVTAEDWTAIRRILRAHARGLHLPGHWNDASDLVQDTILEFAVCPDHIRTGTREQVLTWLRGVLRHKAATVYRKGKRAKRDPAREQALESVADRLADPGASPPAIAERNERVTAVREAIENLSARQQEVLRLHFADGLTEAVIAARLGITRESVSTRVCRGLRALRKLLPPSP